MRKNWIAGNFGSITHSVLSAKRNDWLVVGIKANCLTRDLSL